MQYSNRKGGGEVDLESGRRRRGRRSGAGVAGWTKMFQSLGRRYKVNPLAFFCFSLSLATFLLLLLALYERRFFVSTKVHRQRDRAIYPYQNLHNLVMVAGHSVYTGTNCEKGSGGSENSWFLESYQKHPGQAATFLQHIRAGIESAAKDDEALLLFSGGETRREAGPRSEAQSYWSVAESQGWFGKQMDVRSRALTEEHARDSFENLLFSVCRFRELTGSYPHNITVVSYDFKEERFAHIHRSALRFPAFRFFYVGTPASPSSAEAALKGEALVREQFQEDPYGCSGSLRMKRIGRDPFHRSIPYPNGCPELEGLFDYCGRTLYSESLPWDG
eukprot:Gb_01467 [translate_table: standard]